LPEFCAQFVCSTGAVKVEFAERGIAACLGERDQPIETLDLVDLVRQRVGESGSQVPVEDLFDAPYGRRLAFFSGRSPGKGTEVRFSAYEAFALMIGLQMLNHNWLQKFVVETLRRLRPRLEKEHRKILRRDPAKPLDREQEPERSRCKVRRAGSGCCPISRLSSDLV